MTEPKKKVPKYLSKAMRHYSRTAHKSMTPEERTERARKAAKARWQKHREA